ncbi:MAG: hypothetical protein K2M65_03610 [Muribaculaceae bacterium]|nr:hypothetical protein [Muribaculaceae bacterium]
MEFDETKAIEYMRSQVGAAISDLYDDDQLLNIIDIIWDFYEESGMLDMDTAFNETDDPTSDQIVAHVTKMLSKDKGSTVARDHIAPLVEAEIAYEESIGMADA